MIFYKCNIQITIILAKEKNVEGRLFLCYSACAEGCSKWVAKSVPCQIYEINMRHLADPLLQQDTQDTKRNKTELVQTL